MRQLLEFMEFFFALFRADRFEKKKIDGLIWTKSPPRSYRKKYEAIKLPASIKIGNYRRKKSPYLSKKSSIKYIENP
jgi:hypothetical protein